MHDTLSIFLSMEALPDYAKHQRQVISLKVTPRVDSIPKPHLTFSTFQYLLSHECGWDIQLVGGIGARFVWWLSPTPPSNRPDHEGLLQATVAAHKGQKFTQMLSLISMAMCVHQIMGIELSQGLLGTSQCYTFNWKASNKRTKPPCPSQTGRPTGRKTFFFHLPNSLCVRVWMWPHTFHGTCGVRN